MLATLAPYLIGGVLGLAGVIAALWWRYKLAKEQGKSLGLTKDNESLTADKVRLMDKVLAKETEVAEQVALRMEGARLSVAALADKDRVIAQHVLREEELRDLLRQAAPTAPAVVADRLGRLFPDQGGQGTGG